MATLNGLQGQAHVESEGSTSSWGGYMIFPPNLAHIRLFDIAGPASKGFYEGPIVIEGRYYLANGNVLVRKVNFSSTLRFNSQVQLCRSLTEAS